MYASALKRGKMEFVTVDLLWRPEAALYTGSLNEEGIPEGTGASLAACIQIFGVLCVGRILLYAACVYVCRYSRVCTVPICEHAYIRVYDIVHI